MGALLKFEIKKIIMKKSTIVTFLLLFGIQVFLGISGSLGNTYANDVFVETHAQRNRIDRAHGIAMSGRVIDEALLAEVRENYGGFDWSTEGYQWSDEYNQHVRKYEDLAMRIRRWGRGMGYSFDNMTEEVLYELREQSRESMWSSYELSEAEKAYWTAKETEVEKPFVYEYALGYEMITDMQGIYMTCMLITFFIAISMVTVFAEEHTRKTDQLILCTRMGKGKAYFAKILAGSLVVFGVNLLFVVVLIVGRFYSFGAEGFGAAVQMVTEWYSYPLSMGWVLIIMIGLSLLSSVMVAIFSMLLAEVLRNSIGAMAVVVGLLFAARLVPIPPSFKILSMAWNYFPINMLKIDTGFTDLRLINLFGVQLTSWQFAPILYVILIVAMIGVGRIIYKNYQVSGR